MTNPTTVDRRTMYPIGRKVEGTIRHVWQFGVRLELEGGMTGLIRNGELSWEQVVTDPHTFLHQGQPLSLGRRLKVSVLRNDPHDETLLLSLRRAIYDPWEHLGNRIQEGTRVRGKVVMIGRRHAVIELPDTQSKASLTARLPKDEIVPWKIGSIEDVLERGDMIEACVTELNVAGREMVLSMRARLEDLRAELAGPDTDVAGAGEATEEAGAGDLAGGWRRRKIERVLLVDDDRVQYLVAETLLDELGVEQLEYCVDFAAGAQRAIQEPFDLILMDVMSADDRTNGLDAAEAILAAKEDALVVLVTGNEAVLENVQAQRILLSTAGVIIKPLTQEVLAGALDRLERLGHAGWPGRLAGRASEARPFGQDISPLGSRRQPLSESIEGILRKLVAETGAERAAVFSMDPLTSRVELVGQHNVPTQHVQQWRDRLPKSPVNDVVYEGEEIFDNEVGLREGKYRNLRRLFGFDACIGLRVPMVASDVGHGLFLFRSQQPFSAADLEYAKASAALIGLAIREQWLLQQVAADQRLATLGSAMASIGHELRNHLGGMETVIYLERAWKELRANPGRLQDQAFITRFDGYVERLQNARLGMRGLAELLLGAAPERPDQTVDINACVQSALKLVGLEARQAHTKLMPDLWGGPLHTRGNIIELQHILLNVFLNAIQQMPRARRKRGRITVRTYRDTSDPVRPIRVQVSDTGPGIHGKDLERIFEPMFTTKPRGTGTGLGLYICRDLLSAMGGTIEVVESTIMVGTIFELRLRASHQEH